MSRNCIICKNNDLEIFSSETLSVVGLDPVKIGVSICKKCGCVLQNPLVPQKTMSKFYSKFSNYTNAGNNHRPSSDRIELITNQIKFCLDNLPVISKNEKTLFQIGCSDGFTLSVFKQNGWSVSGIDPSSNCSKIAQENYNIDIFTGFFENFENIKKFKMFVLTHVLEHLYFPKETLQKVHSHIEDGGYLFVEIPCFENKEQLPSGYFSFEHIQFFSEKLIIDLLTETGFEILKIRHFFHEYPIISLVCKKIPTKKNIQFPLSEFKNNRSMVLYHIQKEKQVWDEIKSILHLKLNPENRIFVWGAGIHTSKLHFYTKLFDDFKISGIIDSDSQKHGLIFFNIEISDPKKIKFIANDQIIISSYASENEIYDSIKDLQNIGVTVLKFYG